MVLATPSTWGAVAWKPRRTTLDLGESKPMIFTTPDRPHPSGDGFIRAHFGLNIIGEQRPYCTLTGTAVTERDATADRDVTACGMIHDDVLAAFPELEAFARWHLSSDGEPMHYIANAKFWHDMHNGLVEPGKYQHHPASYHFVSHCAPLDDEERVEVAALLDRPWADARGHLEARQERMRDSYNAEIIEQLPTLVNELQAERGAR